MQKMLSMRSLTFHVVLLVQLLAVGCEEEDPSDLCGDGSFFFLFGCVPNSSWSFQLSGESTTSNETRVDLADGRILVIAEPCRIVDESTGWSMSVASTLSVRAYASGIEFPDGRVLVSGGFGADGRLRRDAELYDPTTNTWTPLDTWMHIGRAGHESELVAEGIVQIRGGAPEATSFDYFLIEEMSFLTE